MVDKTIHTWTIPNFSLLLEEPPNTRHDFEFGLNGDEHQIFVLWLWPNGITDWDTKTLIKMGVIAANVQKYQIKIAVMDSNGDEWMATDGIIGGIYRDNCATYINSPELVIHHPALETHNEQILPDDKFTIRIEVADYYLQVNLSSLLVDSTLSDVVFQVEDREFCLHKAILAASSPVFKIMFTNDMQSSQFNISDISAQEFEQVVKFIYLGKMPDMNRFAVEVFVFADKYEIESLKRNCVRSMIATISLETVLDFYQLADLHTAAQLKAKCVDFIKANFAKIQRQPNWKKLNYQQNILQE